MVEPSFDRDAYPTEDTLDAIRQWPHEDIPGLVAFVRKAWEYEDYTKLSGRHLELHTGGWSGNESLIEALRDNTMFWGLCWRREDRGGHFWFELPGPKGDADADVR